MEALPSLCACTALGDGVSKEQGKAADLKFAAGQIIMHVSTSS